MQMYLGVPWVSTLATAAAALKLVESGNELEARRRNQGTRAKQARVKEIEAALVEKREALNSHPSDQAIQAELSVLVAGTQKPNVGRRRRRGGLT